MAKHLIYLAAGSGRRFGGNKLLYPLEGRPLFSYGLETLRRAVQLRPECSLTVVSRYPQILEAAQAAGGRAVDSPHSERGLSYTIRAALDALPPLNGEDFLFFAVADQPWLEVDTLLRLVDAARPGVPGGTAAFGERVGNPTFFSAALFPKLYALTGDQGGRPILRELGADCIRIQAEHPWELDDLDTPPPYPFPIKRRTSGI